MKNVHIYPLSVLIVLMLMMLGFQWWTMVSSGVQVAKIYELQLPKIIPQECLMNELITSPPEGVARYCFHPVCLSVCVCVCLCICVSGQYFGILFLGY